MKVGQTGWRLKEESLTPELPRLNPDGGVWVVIAALEETWVHYWEERPAIVEAAKIGLSASLVEDQALAGSRTKQKISSI